MPPGYNRARQPVRVMNNMIRPYLSTHVDDATLQHMELASTKLSATLAKLESQGVSTPATRAEYVRRDLERIGSNVLELVLVQPPRQLLGYLWAKRFMKTLNEMSEHGENYRPNKTMNDTMQFNLEYLHAAWSCCQVHVEETTKLDEANVVKLLEALDELRHTTMVYCLLRARAVGEESGRRELEEMTIGAMLAWVNLRGRRYQALDEEFLRLVLKPHDLALRNSYGIGADAISHGIQEVSDALRTGQFKAAERLFSLSSKDIAIDRDRDLKIPADVAQKGVRAFDDLLNAGICNLSNQTRLPQALMQDLSFSRGENTEFLADGDYQATPLRTLPARVKPCIRLGDDYYTTDGQFLRDGAYRAIQRGLLQRDPAYRQQWNERQKQLTEQAFLTCFSRQLNGAAAFRSIYFRDPAKSDWAETDLVLAVDSVLFVIEAKAGVTPMHSPASDFHRHMKTVERLVVKAQEQCGRFLDYLGSANSVPIYRLHGGKHEKVGDLRRADYSTILPIGLTVESLAPFSATAQHLGPTIPHFSVHPFMSMSVEDLLVINRFLPTLGELVHYLKVRQQACAVPDTTLPDESEFLGAYVSLNRFDIILKRQRSKAGMVLWNYFADVVDSYFETEQPSRRPVPRQVYSAELASMLKFLDKRRPRGWVKCDSAIRDLGKKERVELTKGIRALKASPEHHQHQWTLTLNPVPLQVCLCLNGVEPTERELRADAETECVRAHVEALNVLLLCYNRKGNIIRARFRSYVRPIGEGGDKDATSVQEQLSEK